MIQRFLRWLRSFRRPPVKVSFASTERVLADPALHDDFIVRVLGFHPDEFVFISDVTSLSDFGDDAYVVTLQERIRDAYGIDVSDLSEGLLWQIFERIRATSA